MSETLISAVPIGHLMENIQQELAALGQDVEVEHPCRLRQHERVELAGPLAQGGMPRLFWRGVESWINSILDRRYATHPLHFRR